MGSAFTPEEQKLIRLDLKRAGRKYLELYGMRKTSVDQLSMEAGISKGAFYKFYETKEHLFFEILEDLHEEIYIEASKILSDPHLSPLERLETAVLHSYMILSTPTILNFMQDELPYMIRKISPETISAHKRNDSLNITNLLTKYGIKLNYSPDFISSLVRAIISLSREKDVIGEEQFDNILHFLVHTSCVQLLSDATYTNS